MKKRERKPRQERHVGGFDHASSSADFYSASPSEKPLDADGRGSAANRVRRTARHQAVEGYKVQKIDPRERLALLAILKSAIILVLLSVAFFFLWKGIKLYEESIWLDHVEAPEKSPVLQEITLGEEFDIQDEKLREQFVTRIELWKEADRFVRSADALMQHNNYDQAIEKCQDALHRDPSHRGALERLGELYFLKGLHVEAINAYIRLLSVDPSHREIQKRLIEALDAFGDHDAVKYMAEWYLAENIYDADVAHHLADALFVREEYEEAVKVYEKLLREFPADVSILERQATAYMRLQKYREALVPLAILRERNLKNPTYYKQMVVCNAQLGRVKETLQILGRAAQVFGQPMALGLVQDPRLDPVREDRMFQAFVDRVGGEGFRREIEALALQSEEREAERTLITPQLEMPDTELQDEELLRRRN